MGTAEVHSKDALGQRKGGTLTGFILRQQLHHTFPGTILSSASVHLLNNFVTKRTFGGNVELKDMSYDIL